MVTAPRRIRLTLGRARRSTAPGACHQFLHIEWFCNVVVGPETQPAELFSLLGAGCQNDYWNLPATPHDRKKIEPVAVRQRQVKNNKVGCSRPGRSDRASAIGYDLDVIAFGYEIILDHTSERRIVFNDKNTARHC